MTPFPHALTRLGRPVMLSLALLVLMTAPPAWSQEVKESVASPDPSAAAQTAAPAGQGAAPAGQAAPAGGASATPPSGEVKGYTLPPEKYQEAVAYARARYGLYFFGVVWGLVVLVALVRLGVAARFRDRAERFSGKMSGQLIVFAPLLLLTLAFLGLPTDLYGQYLSRKYNQSIQSWGSWAWDWTKGQIIGLIMSTLLIWLLYAVIRKSPKRWWFYFWLASIPIIIFVLFITPVVIDPLFYDFTPLEAKQPALVSSIEKVVERGGLSIPRERMFEMNASTKLKSVNAYVTGFGASKRVVVWDNTIARMTGPQTLFVFGHEMGHYVLGHIVKAIAFTAGLLLVFLYLGYRGMNASLARWGQGWGIRGVADWASLPVLLVFIEVFSFLASPADSTFSRRLEHHADIYGLEVIHGIVPDPQTAGAEAFQILGEINLSDPDPPAFIKFWLYSHPPLNERVVFARSYDPWSKGEPPRFVAAR